MAAMGASQAPSNGAAPKAGRRPGSGRRLRHGALLHLGAGHQPARPAAEDHEDGLHADPRRGQPDRLRVLHRLWVMSMPSAAFLSKIGYAKSVMVGPGRHRRRLLHRHCRGKAAHFIIFLVGLFVMASGVTLLQVAANPLIASMGKPEELASFRLNLSQAFNSLGAACGLWFGANFLLKGDIFKKDVVITDALREQALGFVSNVYLAIGWAWPCSSWRSSWSATRSPKPLPRPATWSARSRPWVEVGQSRRAGHLPLCRRRSGDLAEPAAVHRAKPRAEHSGRVRPAS
jgi:FHS family L-fucose permease-like MFS transporter